MQHVVVADRRTDAGGAVVGVGVVAVEVLADAGRIVVEALAVAARIVVGVAAVGLACSVAMDARGFPSGKVNSSTVGVPQSCTMRPGDGACCFHYPCGQLAHCWHP